MCSELDRWGEFIIVSVHRDEPVDKQVSEALCRITDFVNAPAWRLELADGIRFAKSRLDLGWEGDFRDATDNAMKAMLTGRLRQAAVLLRRVARQVAYAIEWSALRYFPYEEITDATIIAARFLDWNQLERTAGAGRENDLHEMYGIALRVHSALTRDPD